MLKNTTSLLFLFGGVALSLGISITPIIREGSTDILTLPFVRIGNGYYYFETRKTANWFQAFESCRRMNATLISFETMQKWNDITNYLELFNDEFTYWTSGTDLGEQSRHVWFGSGNPIAINIWAPNEPDNLGKNQHCDQLGYRKPNTQDKKGLDDSECLNKMRFICEVPQPYTASFVIWK
ncbi:C-type lectin 37Da-like isoform X4 [Drosophila innubila]|uniref:C-type lectin 37Da-like isoform X4 n=1 Tax=Drosophila innubila TaxID=198719 RepID=UPI00148E8887|nr:C-type lectin 37Da-like isoform X4 [Drosophila innubila]